MQRNNAPPSADTSSLRPLVPAYFAVLGLSMVLFVHAAIAPVVQQALGLTYTELGILLSAIIAGHALLQPLTGWLFVRLGPDRALRVALLYVLTMSAVVPLVERYDVLVALRFVQGLGTGHLFVFAISYVAARSTPATNRQRQAFVGASNGFGPAVLFVTAPALVAWLGWRGPWLLPIAVLLLATVTLVGVRPLAVKASAPTVDLGTYARLLRSARVWALGTAHAASFGIFVALTSWLTTFLLGVTGGDASRSAQVTAGLLTVAGISRLLSAPAAARWGDRALIASALSVGAAALVGLGVTSWPPAVIALGVLAIWCCSFTFAAVFQLAYFTGRPGDGPVVIALLNWITLLAATALPALFGWLTDRTGSFLAGFLLYALVSVVGASSVSWWRATLQREGSSCRTR